jgi:hypothetical protein
VAVPDGKVQFNIHIDSELDAVFDEALAIYGMQKAAFGEALLRHALEDDQVEVAVQKAKDRADQAFRTVRRSRKAAQEATEGPEVTKIPRASSKS